MVEGKAKTISSSGPLPSASQLERGLGEALHEVLPDVPMAGGLIGNKYRVERLIARGGMGAVFAATHIVSGKRVAVKWMLPQLGQIKGARERFIREACATARIEHPNIVDIHDVGSDAGSVYLVMEFLRGETLSQRMSRCPLGEQEAAMLLMPALRGVAAAHAHGVIHRDLKPDNIFLCCNEEGEALEPKVLDFGISKITSDEVRDLALTHSGAVLGTPYYMSPEQVRGARDVDERADVYAFGVMLFEALTGQRPFDADTYNELILKIATEPPPNAARLNPSLSAELIAVVERAMARDPNERFQNIEALALALEAFSGAVRFRVPRSMMDAAAFSSDFSPPPRLPSANTNQRLDSNAELMLARRAHQRGRARVVAVVVALLACGAIGLYGIETRYPERAALAHPAPQPSAAEADLPPSAARPTADPAPAAPPKLETSVLAVEATPVTPARNPAVAKPAPVKRAVAAPRDKRWVSEPPPVPDSLAAPVVVKRVAVPKDWDERLSADAPHTALGDSPAGRIEAQDFH